MSIPREAILAAVAAHNTARLDECGSRAAMEAALTAALPHLLAAKDEEIGRLRDRLRRAGDECDQWRIDATELQNQIAALRGHIEKIVGRAQWYARTPEIQQEFADMARAALEMSGGVKSCL